jgi:hypothetical protein
MRSASSTGTTSTCVICIRCLPYAWPWCPSPGAGDGHLIWTKPEL